MNDAKPLLNFYSTNLSDRFKKIVKPAEDYLAINGVFYSLMTPDGRFFQIGNHPDLAQTYFGNKLYKYNPFICHPDNYYHNETLITSGFPSNELDFQKAQVLVSNTHGFQNFLAIYKKEDDLAHLLLFSSNKKNLPLNSIFISNGTILNRFADHILKEWKPHVGVMERYMIDLGKLMGPSYFKINPLFKSINDKGKKLDFLRNAGMLTRDLNFSSREEECIDHFLEGKTASQIADDVGLSPRTVEHYLNNIKAKAGCFLKCELFQILKEYRNI